MKPTLKIFDTSEFLATAMAQEFFSILSKILDKKPHVSVVLSGGSTPTLFFQELVKISDQFNHWDKILFFWGDERCVPPDHSDSNYGVARKILLEKVPVPEHHIYRIQGENDPLQEANRYALKIREALQVQKNCYPEFDWIFLGLGEDGHTASLFPGSDLLKVSDQICGVAQHPGSGQLRITLTLPVLNQARRITFLVSGQSKSKVVSEIIRGTEGTEKYPAALVEPRKGILEWILDKSASVLI